MPKFSVPVPEPVKEPVKVQPSRLITKSDKVSFTVSKNLIGSLLGNELTLTVPDISKLEKPSKSGKTYLIALTGGWKSLVNSPYGNVYANITIGIKSDEYIETE